MTRRDDIKRELDDFATWRMSHHDLDEMEAHRDYISYLWEKTFLE